MISYKVIPVYWFTYVGDSLKDINKLEECLNNGYEVERVDRIHENDRVPVLIYILKKEENDD